MSETGDVAPPQLSADGYWWWTGAEWVPAADVPEAVGASAPRPEPEPEPQPVPEPEPEPRPVPAEPWNPPGSVASPGWSEPPSAGTGWGPPSPQDPFAPGAAPSWPAPPAYGGYPAPPTAGTSRLALASLVCALAWLFGLGSIAAVVLGVMALRRISRSGGTLGGKGLAVAGTVIGGLGVLLVLLAIAIPTFLSQHAKGWDAEAKITLRNASLAQEAYFTEHSAYTDSLSNLTSKGLNLDPDVALVVEVSNGGAAYCMQALHAGAATHTFYLGSTTGQVSTSRLVACP